MTTHQILIATLIAINIIAFIVVGSDKRRAVRGATTKRIPEGALFFFGSLCGSVGVYIGMLVFRHKIRKWYFQLGIPLLIVQNLAIVYVVRELFLL